MDNDNGHYYYYPIVSTEKERFKKEDKSGCQKNEIKKSVLKNYVGQLSLLFPLFHVLNLYIHT